MIAETNPAFELSSIPFALKNLAQESVYLLNSFLTSASVAANLSKTISISFRTY